MKKEYPYLKQFFEQHKTKHSYKSFVRHRSPERLRQLDEICSSHPFKTRYEEYIRLSDKETFIYKIHKIRDRFHDYLNKEDVKDDLSCLGCLFLIVLVGILFYCCSDIRKFLVLFSVILGFFILISPFFLIIDILENRKLKKMEKSFPYFCHFDHYYETYYYRTTSYDGRHFFDNYHIKDLRGDHCHEGIKPLYISNKFAEECDLCLRKFFDDFKRFFTENQKEISRAINFYNHFRWNNVNRGQIKIDKSIEDIYHCFGIVGNIDLFYKFSSITKDFLDSACVYIQDSGIIVPEELYQIDFNGIDNSIKNHYERINYSPKQTVICITWICLNLFCIGFTGYVFKVKHDLKDRSIASLYQKSYTRYENELRKWENGVFVKIGTSMTDYYRLGEDLSYGYTINGNDVSSNCIIGIPRDNHYVFGVSITEYDDTYSDFGSSSQSHYISKQDLIKGYKVVLETYVHENSTSSTQGYARFKTVFTLSFQNEEYKPREPQKSDFNDDVKVTFSDAFKSAIGLK